MTPTNRLPSPALIVGLIALVMAMAGSAVALPGKGDVETNDLERRAVTSPKIDRQAVRGGKIARNAVKGGKIRKDAVSSSKVEDGSLTGADLADDSIGDEKLSDHEVIELTRVAATAGDAVAAPPQELAKEGPLSLYGKCFTDANGTHAVAYAATAAAGSVLAAKDTLAGDPFLDPGTGEGDREVSAADTDPAPTSDDEGETTPFQVAAPDGTTLQGTLTAFAKSAAGGGTYGDGNSCLFSGTVAG